jgi:ABC-type multidrug transport system fused ATPase/permease subunit
MSLKKGEFIRAMYFMKSRIWKYFIGIFGMSILNASTAVIESYMLKYVIDAAIKKDVSLITKGIAMISLSAIVLIIFIPIFRYMYNKCAKEGLADVRNAVFKHRGTLPISYFEKNHSGNIISRMINDADNMSKLYTERIRRLTYPFIYGSACIVPMFMLDWKISTVLVIINFIAVYLNTFYSRVIRDLSSKIQKSAASIMENTINTIDGIYVIKLFHIGDAIQTIYKKSNSENINLSIKRTKVVAMIDSTNYFIGAISNLGLLAVGAFLVSKNLTTFGNLIALMNLQRRLNQAFLEIGTYIPQLHDALAGAERVFEYLDEKPEAKSYEMMKSDKDDNYIEFKDVNFGYKNKELIFNGLNISINKGQTVALVGLSGSGKSTLIKLLLGFYPVISGKIVVAGKSLSEHKLSELRNIISYVPQDSYIFNGTIEENIRYGNLNSSIEEIVDAAKAANVHEFIMQLPNKYKTKVGERGSRLSGGQKQRIAIARAILKDSPILLLDEATSALDSKAEQQVKIALENIMKNRTTIIIAHRLSTVENSDEIYVLDSGKIVERGNHKSLLKNRGLYSILSNTVENS